MKQQLALVFSVLSLLITSCGKVDYSILDLSTDVQAIPQEFLYHTTGSCADGSFSFSYLQGAGIMLWTDPSQILVGQAELFLEQDSTFSMRYREFTWDQKVFDTTFSGKMSLNNENGILNLENVGTAQLTTYHGRAALELKFTNVVNDSLLLNQKAIFNIRKSKFGLGESDIDHCQYR